MEINEYFILLFLYILTCLWVVKRYYKRDLGTFQAPFIFSLASMLMNVPQFCVIIFNPYYDADLLWDLSYCMITCTLAFSFGWEKALKKRYRFCRDINLKSSQWVFFILFLVGLYCAIMSYGQVLAHFAAGGGDIRGNHTYQILLFFMFFFDVGMFYALTYIVKEKKAPKLVYIILAIGCIYYLYIILMLARRTLVVKLFMSLGLLACMLRPRWQNKIKIAVVVFFTLGTIYQASIGEIRENLHGSDNEINIWETYKQSYYAPDLRVGMDLGNGAMFIKYVKDHGTYNGGLFLWDDIVTWYFPSFIFGQKGKEELKLAGQNNQYIDSITCGVTTQTGYFQAFSAFWYFGFIMFYALGYVLGMIWNKSKNSSLYLIVYLCFMYHLPSLSSHGFSFVVGQIEIFIIFCLPFIYWFTYRKKIV